MIKKLHLTFIFCLLLIAHSLILNAHLVNLNKAEKVAIGFAKQHNNSQFSILNSQFSILNNDTVYYIFSLKPKGFIIISADDDIYPVLGYSFKSNWESGNKQLPDGLKYMLDIYSNQIDITKQQKLRFNNPAIKETWDNLVNISTKSITTSMKYKTVEPLLLSQWNQGAYYNEMCPADTLGPGGHVVAGCVALAMAQVMDYYKYPNQGVGSNSYYSNRYGELNANFGATTYDWNAMPNSINQMVPALAQLIFQCGVSVNMNYAPDGSGASTGNLAYALPTYFNYSDSLEDLYRYAYNDNDWKNIIIGNLNKNIPVIYVGYDINVGGHCFVCDGYQDTSFFHINWGWGGAYDGYFYLDNLNPGGMDFNNYQECLINIFPPSTVYPYNCKGQTVLTASNGVFDDGSGQKNYQNNNDCTWLISPIGIKNIFLKFDKFNTQLNRDIVIVYDGDNETSPIIATFSGNDTVTKTAQSTGNKMLLRFITDKDTTAEGWSASYTCSFPVYCSGVQTLTATSDTFSNGSNGNFYSNNSNCQWLIEPSFAKTITLHFNSFDTELNKDLVKVIDPTTSTPTLLASYSGTQIPPDVTAYNGQMLVIFTTTSNGEHKGWKADYSSTTGINELTNPDNLLVSLYPNPASNLFSLEISSKYQLMDYKYQISILNTLGQIVYSEICPSESDKFMKVINTENLAKGIYTLTILSKSDYLSRKLIIN